MALSEGKAGLSYISDGTQTSLRFARDNALVVTRSSADAALRGKIFISAQQAAAALGTGLTATMVTLGLYNPVGSGIIVRILNASVQVHSPPAGVSGYVLVMSRQGVALPSSNTNATMRCVDGTMTAPKALAFTASTLGETPVAIDGIGAITATGAVVGNLFSKDYDGRICLVEGAAVAIQGLTTASTGICSFLWEEVQA